jgi:hypothetical protein
VAKLPKDAEKMSETKIYDDTKQRMLSSAYACWLTKYFRIATADIASAPMIFYLPPMRFEFDESILGTKYLYAEHEI